LYTDDIPWRETLRVVHHHLREDRPRAGLEGPQRPPGGDFIKLFMAVIYGFS